MERPQGPQTSYMQTAMGWGLKGIAFLTTTPEALGKTGAECTNLLEGFSYSDGHVLGNVEAAKVRDVVKKAMDPIKSFYRAGVVITGIFLIGSRVVSILPIVPSVLLLFAATSGYITWEIGKVVNGMNHTYIHFNRIHLQGLAYRAPLEAESRAKLEAEAKPTVSFEQFVDIIDSYSQQILANLKFIDGFDPIEISLTSSREHLTEQVRNQTERGEASPWDIAANYFPILPLICRVAVAADKVY